MLLVYGHLEYLNQCGDRLYTSESDIDLLQGSANGGRRWAAQHSDMPPTVGKNMEN